MRSVAGLVGMAESVILATPAFPPPPTSPSAASGSANRCSVPTTISADSGRPLLLQKLLAVGEGNRLVGREVQDDRVRLHVLPISFLLQLLPLFCPKCL